jgi:alkane 1-monooxygenase
VMDPRVLAHFGGDISRANISPRKRARILAGFASSGAVEGPGAYVAGGRASAAAGRDRLRTPAAAAPAHAPTDPVPSTADGVGGVEPAVAHEELTWCCPGCGYTYDVVAGEEREGFAAGTAWSEIPVSWCCPDCGVREKVDFIPSESAVAG